MFTGLGSLEREYKIVLKPDCVSFAVTNHRRVPLLLMPKVKEELDHMKHMGVISKVHEPSGWCTGIVVVLY